MSWSAVIVCFLVCIVIVTNGMPIAYPQLVVVQPGSYALIRLRGYDVNVPNLKFTIGSVPKTGSLNQLSKVFSDYGYEPKKGPQVVSGGVKVTGSNNRILYIRPTPDMATNNMWDTFSYSVFNGVENSYNYTVTLVPPSGALIGSDFLLSNEGWTIVGNKGQSEPTTFEPLSRGQQLNHYIYGTDNVINSDQFSTRDRSLWYFQAPSKFLGNIGIAYGGSFQFSLGAFSGDFTKLQPSNTPVVILECATCVGPVGPGITLVYPISALKNGAPGPSPTLYTIPLDETKGWLKDPQNSLLSWGAPSKCDIIQVLSRLSAVKILGDWTTWYESVAIDNVQFLNLQSQLPLCSLTRPDASLCDSATCK